MSTLITQTWGTGNNVGRSAKIFVDNDGYFVEGYIGAHAVKQIIVDEVSIDRAENIADDWVWGLIEE